MRVFDCWISPEIFEGVEVMAADEQSARKVFMTGLLRALSEGAEAAVNVCELDVEEHAMELAQ